MTESRDPNARLRRLQEDEASYFPLSRQVKVTEHLVRFPHLPGAPQALYGGLIQIQVVEEGALTESRLSPLETERGLYLDEHQETVARALARHGADLRERLE